MGALRPRCSCEANRMCVDLVPLLLLVSNPQSPALIIRTIARTTDLAIASRLLPLSPLASTAPHSARHPCFQVHLAEGGGTEVLGGDLEDAISQLQGCQHRFLRRQ